MILRINAKKVLISILLLVLISGAKTKDVLAQATNPGVLYVPLIGITSVPDPLVLPGGPGNVTYHYAVKNFLPEAALINVQVVDNNCSPVKFVNGDDNNDSKLDYNETWRYTCTTKISTNTQSFATATGIANNITATHKAFATVIVGSSNPSPLISIINITKIAFPLSLSSDGSNINFTYKVNNPGIVPLSDVSIADDKCSAISGKLGDTNGNSLLDVDEVWIYSCATNIKETTINTATATGFANGLKAIGEDTISIKVNTPIATSSPLFDVAINPTAEAGSNFKIIAWETLSAILMVLIIFSVLTRKIKLKKIQNNLAAAEKK